VWFVYIILPSLGSIFMLRLMLRYDFPDIYPEIFRPAAKKSVRFVWEMLGWAIPKVIRGAVVVWNNPDKILLFVFELPVKIFIGFVTLLVAIVKIVPKIPAFLKKALIFLWRPNSEEKAQKKDVLQDIRNYIRGCGLGSPFSELEIQHLFYIAFFQHYGRAAIDNNDVSAVDKALGAYISRQELPFWIKSFIRRYEDDRSLKTLDLPLWPKIRRSIVDNWLEKNPRTIVTVDDFEALPWWMKTLTRGYCREKVNTLRLIKHCFKRSVPEQQREDIPT